jgi:hypothetical protein
LEVRTRPAAHEINSNKQDEHARRDEEPRCRWQCNRQGMGGNNDYNHDNSDPFAKVKFTIPAFYGAYDAEVYLGWEMTVEQKLNSHLVPEVHRVRQAISEYSGTNYACSIQCLFQLAMLAEKELQGHQRSAIKGAAVFTPQPSTSNIGAPSSRAPAVPSTNATRASTSYTSVKMTTTPTVPNTISSSPSTSHSSDIRCHLCQLLGYMQRECLSKCTYIATADGGYISTSDIEDDDIAVANITGDDNHHKTSEEEILGALDTDQYRTVIVQRSLSAQVDHAEKIQCHNLFHIFFIINDCRVLPIIDGGSCNNLVNSSVVKKLGL